MSWPSTAIALVALLATAFPAAALPPDAPPIEEHPGYFDIDGLGLIDPADSSVDINLRGAMLRLVGASVLSSEPGLAELVNGLELMRVMVAPVSAVDAERAGAAFTRGAATLEGQGWQRVVRVKDEGEQVHLYVREVEGEIVGLTIFVLEAEDEAVLINMVGKIDVDLLGAIGQAFDLPTIEAALEEGAGTGAATEDER